MSSAGLRFLYRAIRSSSLPGNGVEVTPPRGAAAVGRHIHSVIRGIRGVIFDMDGTLTVPVLDFAEMRSRLGLPQGTDILPAVRRMPAEQQARAMKIIEELEEEASKMLQLQPGVLDLLHMLVSAGVERALVTRNSPEGTQVFMDKLHQELADRKHLYPLLESNQIFSQVLTRDFTPCKPDPAAVYHICRQWGVEPAHVVFIGDDITDMRCCRNAGAAVGILLKNPRNARQEDLSDVAVDTLHDIVPLFNSCITVYRN